MRSNRNRTYAEIEEKEKDEELKELEKEKLKIHDQILDLANKIDYLKNMEIEYKANQDKLSILFENEIIDSDGNPIK